MMTFYHYLKFLFSVSLAFLLVMVIPISAQATETSLGFAPDSLYLDLDAGETYSDEVVLWSHELEPITLYSVITTFKQIENFPGTSAPLFEEEYSEYTYSAASWVTKIPSEVKLKEGGENTVNIPFTIIVPENTKDGLYRVKISFTTNSEFNIDSDVQTRNNLLIGPSVLIKVGENLKESLIFQKITVYDSLTAFYTDKIFYDSMPVKLTTNLYNDGETYVIPVGDIIIYNWLNQEVDRIKFNEETLSLIDGEVGSFNTIWDSEQQLFELLIDNKIAFGKMHAKILFTYSTTDPAFSALTAQTSFWMFPWKVLLVIILLIISFIVIKIRKITKDFQDSQNPSIEK